MPSSESITVGLIQHSCSEDVQANLEKSIEGIQQAAESGARLVVLQELHNSLYFCQTEHTDNFSLAETIPGPTTERLSKLARQLQLVIVCSLFEKRTAGIYHNTAVVIENNGQIVGKYRKMHIPDDPGYSEKFYFTPGDMGFLPIKTSVATLGVLICWDQWFPEAARLMALAGAEILIYPTAIGWEPTDNKEEKQRQLESWQIMQRSHAIANAIPVISCNRTGLEHSITNNSVIDFWGGSFVCGTQGEWIAQAPKNKDHTLIADINLHNIQKTREIWPFLRDRRIDAYEDLLLRYRDQ